jgi:hypothetical protein
MSTVQLRPFRRSDRDQLTRLVNAHAEAVVLGRSASVNAVLGSLERQPGEFVEDPWVSERVTLVADLRDRVVAAAHLRPLDGTARSTRIFGRTTISRCPHTPWRIPQAVRVMGWLDTKRS